MIGLTLLPWVLKNWRIILILAVAGALYGAGRHNGASAVKARWNAVIIKERAQAQAEKDAAQHRANEHSAAYQSEIIRQKSIINQLDRKLKHEISKSYSACVVNDDLARLWRDTFAPAADGDAAR